MKFRTRILLLIAAIGSAAALIVWLLVSVEQPSDALRFADSPFVLRGSLRAYWESHNQALGSPRSALLWRDGRAVQLFDRTMLWLDGKGAVISAPQPADWRE